MAAVILGAMYVLAQAMLSLEGLKDGMEKKACRRYSYVVLDFSEELT